MKKLLFVLAFTFIGQQAFSQIYLVTIVGGDIGGCAWNELTITKVPPSGPQTNLCVLPSIVDGSLVTLNQELNSIISLGYTLIETSYGNTGTGTGGIGLVTDWGINVGTTFIFAIP